MIKRKKINFFNDMGVVVDILIIKRRKNISICVIKWKEFFIIFFFFSNL